MKINDLYFLRFTESVNLFLCIFENMESEAQIQAKIVSWFWNNYPNYRGLLYHNFNNPRNAVNGSRLLALGLIKGNPDLTLAIPRANYGALYIELKKPGQKPRPDQKKQLERLEQAGNCVIWSSSVDEVKGIIKKYLSLE